MNDGGLTILHLSAFFCLFRFYVIWWLLHFNNAACKKRGTKVRGINQIIPIYPSRSEYARKCPKTVSKTSQQTCCLRELRFLDEIKKVCARFWHDFYQKGQKLQKFRHFRKHSLELISEMLYWEKCQKNRLRIIYIRLKTVSVSFIP